MVTAAAQKPQHIMAIRFFQAIFESSTFVGTHYILGSWYTEKELGKRSGIFTSSGLAGTMIGGFIQTGIHKSMNGLSGLSGWRWLFIIDGIITLPVALYGFLLFPDTPRNTKAPYFSADEKALAMSRVPEVGERTPISWRFLKHCFGTWYWYVHASVQTAYETFTDFVHPHSGTCLSSSGSLLEKPNHSAAMPYCNCT